MQTAKRMCLEELLKGAVDPKLFAGRDNVPEPREKQSGLRCHFD
jgi:hypothetical protein